MHKKLLQLTLQECENDWSLYIHNSYSKNGIVKRVVEWTWNKNESLDIDNEALYLYGLTLAWFLTSSNRELRDGATKALVSLFTDNTPIFLNILKQFENVNDLYILERLYAVAYGIILRSSEHLGFKELGEYIYATIFDKDDIIEHLQIRDYAKLTVEYLKSNHFITIDISKTRPPYGSKLPSILPTNNELEIYKTNIWNERIISSMVTEYGNGIMRYGDFGRYKFEYMLKNFQNVNAQGFSNFATKYIFEQMHYDGKYYEDIEQQLNRKYYDRNDHGQERLGKKYQWIATNKVLAIIADNHNIVDHADGNITPYRGAWQINIRDIDPTTILRNKSTEQIKWWFNLNQNFEDSVLTDAEWIQSGTNLPIIDSVINIQNNGKEFLILDMSADIDGDKSAQKYRNLYYQTNAFICKKAELNKLIKWAENKNFYGQDKMPNSRHFSKVFLREYPNGEAYKYFDRNYYSQVNWTDICEIEHEQIPCKILPTTTAYFNERAGYDRSINESIHISLPNKWLVEQMKLRQSINDGEWLNDDNEIVFFDPTIISGCVSNYNENGVLIADKKILLDFLEENDLAIFWTAWGEKQVRDTDHKLDTEDFFGTTEFSEFAYLDSDQIKGYPQKISFRQ